MEEHKRILDALLSGRMENKLLPTGPYDWHILIELHQAGHITGSRIDLGVSHEFSDPAITASGRRFLNELHAGIAEPIITDVTEVEEPSLFNSKKLIVALVIVLVVVAISAIWFYSP